LNKRLQNVYIAAHYSLGLFYKKVLRIEEVERYSILGRRAEEALRTVCKGLKLGMTENEIAGRVAESSYSRGLIPVLTLVAADERIEKYRHPIPTDNEVQNVVMIALCAKYCGLITSLSRLVSFGPISDDLRRRHEALVKVDAMFISSRRPGVKYSDIFHAGVKCYDDVGFPDEWRLHHQGGPAGYESRDFKADFDSHDTVKRNQAVAWNPSITGTKSEDTTIAREGKNLIVTKAVDWPMINVQVGNDRIARPDILTV